MNETEHNQVDSNLLRTFVEIATCGNLTQASAHLNRSQSAISVQLRRLERELNVSLFERQSKGMVMTIHGEKLMPLACRVLDELGKVRSSFVTPLKGRIRVGIPDDFEENVLARTLATFTHNHPGVEVAATSGCTANFPDAIENGELDIAVCSGTGQVSGEVFLNQKMFWIASKTLYIGKKETVPLAVINHRCWMGELPKKSLDKIGRQYDIAYECSGLSGLKAAIQAGFAIGILLESNVEKGMKILSEAEGFPPLPMTSRSIILRNNAPEDLTTAMANALRQAV